MIRFLNELPKGVVAVRDDVAAQDLQADIPLTF